MKYVLAILVSAAALAGARPLSAHESFRVVGTIATISGSDMHVKNREGKTFTIALTKKTNVSRDKEKALPLSVLKTGQSVVVDAFGDGEDDLEALEIRIVPPIAAKAPSK